MHNNKARSHMITRADNQNEHRPASAACIVYIAHHTYFVAGSPVMH